MGQSQGTRVKWGTVRGALLYPSVETTESLHIFERVGCQPYV